MIHWIMQHVWAEIAIVVVGAIVIYLVCIVLEAWIEVKNAPRTDMIVCQRHGPIPASCMLHLEGITEKPIEACPFCFGDNMKRAKAGKL